KERFARGGHVEIFGNRGRKRGATGGKPLRMKMALDKIRVRKVDRGGDYDAVDHRARIVEEILVVWALGRAVRHNKCRLTTASGATAPLGIVRRCWGHVTQVYDIH